MKDFRIDEIGFSNFKIKQIPDEFCYGIDAVILANFAATTTKGIDLIGELGTGNGIIPLVLSHKMPRVKIVAFELQEKVAKLAKENVELNNLSHRVEIVNQDIRQIPRDYFGTFNTIVSNPPYIKIGSGLANMNNAKMVARHETTATLKDFIKKANELLKEKGHFYIIHRPSRLVDILSFARQEGLEAKELQMIAPKASKSPNLVVIHFVKGGGTELKILPQLYVYNEDGTYTEDIDKIYERIL